MLTHFSLFTGIGGIDLAAEWAGFTTVGQCEWADYPTKVLEKHWPNIPRWRDIRDVTAESVRARGIGTIDIISGGDPCQPHSVAGLQKGKTDERYLWPEMRRVIQELLPTWVINENVTGSLSNGIVDEKIYDLEIQGYKAQPFIIPACSAGADNKRDRVFIIAYASSKGLERIHETSNGKPMQLPESFVSWYKRKTTPRVLRRGHGIPNWMDRVKCLGNAVNPYHAYPILQAIYMIETRG